jgi:tRNA(fMet)-specific endonuclease VapC
MLDTNICIYAIKKNENVLANIQANRNKGICISAITLSELEHGICNSSHHTKNRLALTDFLTILDVLPYDEIAAREYGILRTDLKNRGYPIGNMDMLIAAHAIATSMTLVTNNTSEFGRVRGLALADWSGCGGNAPE